MKKSKRDKQFRVLQIIWVLCLSLGVFIGIKVIGPEHVVIDTRLPLFDFDIVLDSGHGGETDPGTIGVNTGVYESQINIDIANILKKELENLGAKVYMTNTGNNALVQERLDVINGSNADFAISIHQNANEDDSSIKGTQILVRDPQYYELADNMQEYFNNIQGTGLHAQRDPWIILKDAKQPSFIIECGFLTNNSEELKLSSPNYQQDISKLIVDWLVEYYQPIKLEKVSELKIKYPKREVQ
ncbi:MAG: N-acetylmuramoyl-L-alanine amidase [Erysipelotrichaceae bacterium]